MHSEWTPQFLGNAAKAKVTPCHAGVQQHLAQGSHGKVAEDWTRKGTGTCQCHHLSVFPQSRPTLPCIPHPEAHTLSWEPMDTLHHPTRTENRTAWTGGAVILQDTHV